MTSRNDAYDLRGSEEWHERMARALRFHAVSNPTSTALKASLASRSQDRRAEQSRCCIGKLTTNYDGSSYSRRYGLDVLPRHDHFHRFKKSSDLNICGIVETVGHILC
jgi:hypothetical protein